MKVTLCYLIILLTASSNLIAQSEPRRATLMGWEQDVRLFTLDRSNNFGGFYYDRGLFRMHTLDMDMEYQLDIFTYQFSYFDDYQWNQASEGFRTYAGSLNTIDFALNSRLKNKIELNENGHILVEALQQDDRRANRVLFQIGYEHQLGDNHQLGFSNTLSQSKPDIDATFHYQYGNQKLGFLTAEVSLLDWFNNIVSDLTLRRESDFEVKHVYSDKPYLFTLRLESPVWRGVRGEAIASIQTRSQSTVNQRDAPGQDFILRHWVNYQAALLESSLKGVTTGIIFQRTFAKMERFAAPESEFPLDFGNSQETLRGGAYLTWQWKNVGIEQWFWIERNSDLQLDENPEAFIEQDPNVRGINRYPFEFNELRRWNRSRIFYRPDEKGVLAYVEHNGDWRDFAFDENSETVRVINYRSYYPNQLVSRNERVTMSLGYQFSPRFWIRFGASIDIDGDLFNGWDLPRDEKDSSRFDGGFTRIFLRW